MKTLCATGLSRAFNFASLVLVVYVNHELQALYLGSTPCECTIYSNTGTSIQSCTYLPVIVVLKCVFQYLYCTHRLQTSAIASECTKIRYKSRAHLTSPKQASQQASKEYHTCC